MQETNITTHKSETKMNKKEVIKKIGKERWKAFQKFMDGQTVSVTKDGEIDYYIIDVENFLAKPSQRFWD